MTDALVVGSSGTARLTVGEADTAIALGSGDVPVLGTPRVIALMEQATCSAVQGEMPDGWTSVGARIELDHLVPSPVGSEVEATAVLSGVFGRRLVFDAVAMQGGVVIAQGTIVRVLVQRAHFASG